MIKKLFLMVIISITLLQSCKDSIWSKSKYDTFRNALDNYEPIGKWKMDSMQVINKFIDEMPVELKSNGYIQQTYINNIDSTLEVNNIEAALNDSCIKYIGD